jgi:SAM-dependent methyltransferase
MTPCTDTLLPYCLCGSGNAYAAARHGLDVLVCQDCGVTRQHVPMTSAQYADFYKSYHGKVYAHRPEHDREIGALRVKAHGEFLWGRILDIGCGSGGFVWACRNAGHDAEGQEVGPGEDPGIYRAALTDIGFPTGWADTVTLHDVLEHVEDPKGMVQEIARIVKPGGSLIIDVPDFFSPDAKHHWKTTEHIWLYRQTDVEYLIVSAGFVIERVDRPIPGKMVFYATRLGRLPVRILVPPGIGDIYWVFTKLRAFCEAKGIGVPEIWIDAPDDKKRSEEFVRRVPFVSFGGYHENWGGLLPTDPMAGRLRRLGRLPVDPARIEAYREDGAHVFPGVDGFDWFISFNGSMNVGRALSEMDPEYRVDWSVPVFLDKQERAAAACRAEELGPYIVSAWFSAGMYKRWIAQFPPQQIYETLSLIHDATGYRIALTGAAWDRSATVNAALLKMDEGQGRLIDLIGRTTLPEYFGLLHESKGCVGFPAGNTMMAAIFGKPTVLLWNDRFDRRMHTNALPPDRPYTALNTALHRPADVARAFLSLIDKEQAT